MLDYIRLHGHHLHHQKYHHHLRLPKPHQFQQEIYLNLHPTAQNSGKYSQQRKITDKIYHQYYNTSADIN
jgi:hypothetical protein